jgi:phosphoglycolate phosphatase-like HAD superfamily hydrolase
MARRGGATALAVTTGMTTRDEWLRQPGKHKPDHILANLRELLACLPQEARA